MVPARVIPMGPNDHHARCVVEARPYDDHGSWAIATVIRSADHNLPGEVRISKTQRDADPRLGLGDASSESKQKSDDNEDAFHKLPPWCCLPQRRHAPRSLRIYYC